MRVDLLLRGRSMQCIIGVFSIVGFLLLFPVFPFYHTFVAFGFIPPFLGGFFSPISLILLVGFSLLAPWWLAGMLKRTRGYGIFITIFLIYVLLWSCVNYFLQYDDINIEIAFVQSIAFIFLSIVLFVLGYLLPFTSIFLKKMVAFFIWVSFLYLFYYAVTTGKITFYARQMHETGDSIATYQGFARSALVSLVFLLVVSRTLFARGVIVSIGMFTMFVLGARSELVAFFIAASLLFIAWSSVSLRYKILTISTLSGIIFISILNIDFLSQSRQFQLTNISESSSWIAREGKQIVALGQISENPILGLFGGHVIAHDSIGSYAHNALSAWVSYGAISFFLYLLLCFIPAAGGAYYVLIKRDFRPAVLMSFAFGFSVILLIIFAKSIFWSMPAFVWGVYANYLATRNRL